MPGSLTAAIAAGAARLVVEEGLEYGAAKRRAARDLGASGHRRAGLPGNDEVEDQVRDYLALFRAETQPLELAALRRMALVWMERLAAFRPHLAGAVWRGTATRLSDIRLDLYCDDSKAAELALIDRRIDYAAGSGTDRSGRDVEVLSISSFNAVLETHVLVLLTILDHDDLRGALKPDARGRPLRGDPAAVRALLGMP